MHFKIDDMREGYRALVKHVIEHGERSAPRGLKTLDANMTTIELPSTRLAVPTNIGRRLNMKIGAAETIHLIAGVSDVVQLDSASNGRFSQFTDDGILQGAYGPRVFKQVPAALTRLAHDSSTRQAVISIWQPDELEYDHRDTPCTLALDFRIINDKLCMYTVMRSNDLWLGLPYDIMMFTRLQSAMAWALGVRVGEYTHTALSLHLYERDLPKTERLHAPDGLTVVPFFQPTSDSMPSKCTAQLACARWHRLQAFAKLCVIDSGDLGYLNSDMRWYFDVLEPTRSGNTLCSTCRYVKPYTEFYECHMPRQCQGTCVRCAKERDVRLPQDVATARLGCYGLTKDDYTNMIKQQNGACAICRQKPSDGLMQDFIIDYDHVTGNVRGLLCDKCDNGLRLLGDDVEGVSHALHYLRGVEHE